MEISGKIIAIFDTAQVSATFKKREFVVEYKENPESNYTELIKFELVQDKCDLLNDYAVGDEVNVNFNLKGRKWTDPQGVDKYFTTLQAWRLGKTASAPAADQPPAPADEPPAWMDEDKDTGDLPF